MPWQKVNELGNDPAYLEPRVQKNASDIANLNEEVNTLNNGMAMVVKSVNGNTPDEVGNVTIEVSGGGDIDDNNVSTVTTWSSQKTSEELTLKTNNTDFNDHIDDGTAHGLGDRQTLQTSEKTTIVAAINELFTNVSSGKTLVGTAITDKDPTIIVPTDPTFQDLATAVSQIKTGPDIQIATGTVTHSMVGNAEQRLDITGIEVDANNFFTELNGKYFANGTTKGYLLNDGNIGVNNVVKNGTSAFSLYLKNTGSLSQTVTFRWWAIV